MTFLNSFNFMPVLFRVISHKRILTEIMPILNFGKTFSMICFAVRAKLSSSQCVFICFI